MRKILLIGGSGQLGSALQNTAKNFDFKIVAPVHDELDACDPENIDKFLDNEKADLLINASAYVKVPKCEDEPIEALRLNSVAVRDMARLSKKKNIRFVTYSTCYVFDGECNEPYAEDDRPNPLQMYGISKFAGELAARNYYPENSFVIRTGALYGGGLKGSAKGNFVLDVLNESKEKEVIERSSEQFINPTYAGSLAFASLELLLKNPEPGIYHLNEEGYASWDEFAREILKLSGSDIKVLGVDRDGRSGEMKRPKFGVLSNNKAKKYGVVLPPWREGLKSYLAEINKIKV